ncbi:hypothetical protein [Wenzhouxiangella limi]|uniref:Uncharacterized protein n=1 Tax=Wenzhouxiangella limi TaxID=2707351 RepID=A0A845UUR8_9GAMM|nr:hypothetical protein [Wenzhouxiangella limi]NDY94298.1 hypothetical protein [Wenzhouxiangella limi]
MRASVMTVGAALIVAGMCFVSEIEAGFKIVVLDDPDVGLNDPAEREPIDGNNGTTLGQQRLNVLQAAADRWAEFLDLDPSVEIRVGAEFIALDCEEDRGVLGSARSNFVYKDFANAPAAGVWYSAAQAEALAVASGGLLAADRQHIGTFYNLRLDEGDETCLRGASWYYGLDPEASRPAGTIPLFPVVLHEFAHGLGFATLVNLETGALFQPDNEDPLEDAYMRFLFDTETDSSWSDMTDTERQVSALNDPTVVWTGADVAAESNRVTAPEAFSQGQLRMHAPDPIEPGSSISHWSPTAEPSLLMEPSLTSGLFDQVDLTPALFSDIGWPIRSEFLDLIFSDRFQ